MWSDAGIWLFALGLGGLAFGAAHLLARPTARLLGEGGLLRKNYRGRYIPAGAGVVVPIASIPSFALAQLIPGLRGLGAPWIGVLMGMALLGLLDDAAGDQKSRGLAGHFRALLGGRLTTGALKALVGASLALYAGWSLFASVAACLLAAVLIALSANAVNLLDLRPVRALKGFFLLVVAAAAGVAVAGASAPWSRAHLAMVLIPAGAALALWKGEARAEYMLGDAGANALGAAAGLALAAAAWPWQMGAAVLLAGLHALCERRSLTALIARVPFLELLDRLGRPPEPR